jgi:hypothetical protein
MNKIFKFWKWKFEMKLSKVKDSEKVEFLTKELLKELNVEFQNDCNYISIFTHSSDKSIVVRANDKNTEFNY